MKFTRGTHGTGAEEPPVTGLAVPIGRASLPPEAEKRLKRLRALAWFLDRSIPVGPWRVGLDPIIGLLPGAGDWIAAGLSVYVLYEGARLGLPASVLTRMAGNILVEAIVGTIPVAGDMFDFAWQANMRNVRLVEEHYRASLPPRTGRKVGFIVLAFALLVFALIAALVFLVAKAIIGLFE